MFIASATNLILVPNYAIDRAYNFVADRTENVALG
jgi:hypothetical protein